MNEQQIEQMILDVGRAVPLVYDRRFPVDTSWDLGVGDETVILFWQTIGNEVRLIDWYSAANAGLNHFAEVLAARLPTITPAPKSGR